MKRSIFVLCLTLHACLAFSQGPKLRLLVGAGTDVLWISYLNIYAEPFQKLQPTMNVGVGLGFSGESRVQFAPEASLETMHLKYNWQSAGDDRSITSNLWLVSTRLSPAMRIQLHPRIVLRCGVDFLISTGNAGNYAIETYTGSTFDTVQYGARFSQLRQNLNMGPSINVGYATVLRRGGEIEPRISGFLGTREMLKKTFATPHNPRVWRLALELVYTFPPKR